MKQLFTLSLFFAACGAEIAPLDESGGEIINGRRDNRHRAVGQVGTDWPRAWFCTGTLIGRRTVLTAAHCLYDLDGRRLEPEELLYREDTGVLRVADAITDRYRPGSSGAWNDIAILTLLDPSDEDPIPVSGRAPREGQSATVVGFGVTRATGPHTGVGGGERRSATITLAEVDDREIAYDASEKGACYGDSGGPVLARVSGRQRVIGVTSRGTAADCRDIDVATRVDAFAAWIADHLL